MSRRSPPPPAYLYREIGISVADERLKRNWSQTELAESVGMTRGSIANLELGRQRATLSTLWALARVFGIEVRTLIPKRRGR